HLRIAGKSALPVAVTEHHHRVPVRPQIVVWSDGSADEGNHAEHREIPTGHEVSLNGRLRLRAYAHVQGRNGVTGDIRRGSTISQGLVLLLIESGLHL